MQIQAGLTLGLLAWDKKDRATAARRYKETLNLADAIPEFRSVNPNAKHLEKEIQLIVQEIRDNLAVILRNDILHTSQTAGSNDAHRKTNLFAPNLRAEKDGTLSPAYLSWSRRMLVPSVGKGT